MSAQKPIINRSFANGDSLQELHSRNKNKRYYEQKHIHDSFLRTKESSKQIRQDRHYDPCDGQWRVRTVQLEIGHRSGTMGCDMPKDDRCNESRTRIQRKYPF